MNIRRREFILDENVLISAQTGHSDRGEPDTTCMELLTKIIDICHTLVVDANLYGRYLHQLNRIRQQPAKLGHSILPMLNGAVQTLHKVRGFERAPAASFAEEDKIPQGSWDDVHITVRLAVETRATLVTADEALREDLSSSGITSKYSLTVLSPEEALRTL